MLKRLLGVLVGAALGLAMVVFAPLPKAEAATGCYPVGYKTKFDVYSVSHAPVITHAYNWVLAPDGKISRTVTVEKVASVTASVQFQTKASFGAEGVVARASVEAGVTLQAAGTATYSSSVSEYIEQKNTTSANREYVYYRGTMKWSGNYKITYCNSATYQEYSETGTWKSWTVNYEGTVRCDLSAPNTIAAAAKSKYCG